MKDFNLSFVGIGASKCGTTWIARCLAEHPEVCMSEPKEPNFFNDQMMFTPRGTSNYKKGYSWYKKHFKNSEGKKLTEFSVEYFSDPVVPKRIAKDFPDIKIVLSLRSQIDRLYSGFYHFKKSERAYRRDYPKLLEKEEITFEDFIENVDAFMDSGYYTKHLKRWYKHFPKKNIQVLIYDDMKKDRLKFIKKVFKHLDLDDKFVPPNLEKSSNVARIAPGGFLTKMMRKVDILYNKHGYNKGKDTLFTKSMRKLKIVKIYNFLIFKFVYKRSFSKPKMKPETEKKLRKMYYDDVKELSKMLKRDLLTEWGFK